MIKTEQEEGDEILDLEALEELSNNIEDEYEVREIFENYDEGIYEEKYD